MAIRKRSARAEYWQRMVDRFHASSLSVTKFCAKHKLSTQSFYQWRRKLRPKSSALNASFGNGRFLPVRIVPSEPSGSERPEVENGLVQIMTPSGYSVRVSGRLPASRIAELISAIESPYRGEGDLC